MTSWFFIEMAAKSALICSIALLLAMALKNRAAADRSMVLRVGAGLLVALPLIDLAFPVLEIEAFAAPAAPFAGMSQAQIDQMLAMAATLPAVEPTIWDDPTPLIMILWGAGALAVLARLAVGLVTLGRWTRSAEPVTDPHWLQALERARAATGASDRLRLMVADKVPGPLGWGWRNPVILIDYDTHAEPEEADAILAHEVAHVARRDWPSLMMTRLATALFWFNPLAWTLAREAIHQAEEAADAHAARSTEPTRYAETLLSWGQIGRGIGVPANSIAPGARALSRRVRAVLDANLLERSARSRVAMVAVLLCVGVAAPVAALKLVEEARPPEAPRAPSSVASLGQPNAPLPPEPMVAPVAPVAPRAPRAPLAPEIEVEVAEAMEELREVLPRVPSMVREAMSHVDHAQIARAVAHAQSVNSEEFRNSMARARAAHAEAIAAIPRVDHVRLQAQLRAAIPSHEQLQQQIRAAMSHSRAALAAGAVGMEQGAARMEAQARRFRDRNERQRIIEEQRARGKTVTHEDLLEAADGMEQGARGMREGARGMREGFAHDED